MGFVRVGRQRNSVCPAGSRQRNSILPGSAYLRASVSLRGAQRRRNLEPTALPHRDCFASLAMTASLLIPTLIIDKIVRTCYIGVSSINARGTMSETERDCAIGYGKPPVGRRFQK